MSSKSIDKRTYVWAKAERTCVLLAIGVSSMSSKSGDKRTYVWAKAKRTWVLLAIGEQEREIQNAQTGVVNVIKVHRQKDICMGKSRKDMCPFSYWSVANVIKVRRQKDICMGKSQMDMCPFSYWRAREGNSECTGKFHQSPETKKTRGSKMPQKAGCAGSKKVSNCCNYI